MKSYLTHGLGKQAGPSARVSYMLQGITKQMRFIKNCHVSDTEKLCRRRMRLKCSALFRLVCPTCCHLDKIPFKFPHSIPVQQGGSSRFGNEAWVCGVGGRGRGGGGGGGGPGGFWGGMVGWGGVRGALRCAATCAVSGKTRESVPMDKMDISDWK